MGGADPFGSSRSEWSGVIPGLEPEGNLLFDNDHIRIWGLGLEVEATRGSVQTIHFSTPFGTNLRLTSHGGRLSPVTFSTMHPKPIRLALRQRGWRVTGGGPVNPRIGR